MHKLSLTKPDGRDLFLYSRQPLTGEFKATNPPHGKMLGQPHLRWHPLRGEWVAFAAHRQDRTFMPPKEFDPLAPTKSDDFPTELPAGDYDVAVFANLFASLDWNATEAPESTVDTRRANGRCEVVVFTQAQEGSLGGLSVDHIALLLRVWADRHREIGKHPEIQYVMPFENRGVEVGVTLHHPHGQIYAYPFIPPVQERMLHQQKEHYDREGSTLLGDLLADELRDGSRIVHESTHAATLLPACARYPYETWIVPKRPVGSLAEMTDDEINDFARTLKTTLLKYDGLWQRPFPYLMTLNSAPTDGKPHPEWHFHVQFSPPYRTKDRLKFLAGTELGSGMFVNDSLPEQKAEELRNVAVNFDRPTSTVEAQL